MGPEAYIDREGVWKSKFIAVCWEQKPDKYIDQRRFVREAVATYIGSEGGNSKYIFLETEEGVWPECNKDNHVPGIWIKIRDITPRSQVGRQYVRDAAGNKLKLKGEPQSLPTRMILNFEFEQTVSVKNLCFRSGLNLKECIEVVAVHEFLHALSFLHEQLRSDADPECKELWERKRDVIGYDPDFAETDYDPDSIMNYCGDIYKSPIQLSNTDKHMLIKIMEF